jgi:hypothetical protein
VWWCTSIIPAFGRQRQEDREVKVSLGHMRLCLKKRMCTLSSAWELWDQLCPVPCINSSIPTWAGSRGSLLVSWAPCVAFYILPWYFHHSELPTLWTLGDPHTLSEFPLTALWPGFADFERCWISSLLN